MLGIKGLNWYGTAGPSYIGPAVQGVTAIRAGMAHTVLTVRIINQRLTSSEELSRAAKGGPIRIGGDAQFTAPFGSVSPVFPIAGLPAQRHMDCSAPPRSSSASHVVAQRLSRFAQQDAIFREPITSRIICGSLHRQTNTFARL